MEKQALKIYVIFNTQLMEQSRIESIRFDFVDCSITVDEDSCSFSLKFFATKC